MTITLPDELREVLEARAKARGYETVDEYAQDRLECDDEPEFELTEENRQWLIEMAEEGLKSGPAVEMDVEKFFKELERRLQTGESLAHLRP